MRGVAGVTYFLRVLGIPHVLDVRMIPGKPLRYLVIVLVLLALAACSGSELDPPEMQGPAAMVDDAGKPRLWVLSKQEEQRTVGVGGGTRSSTSWRTDTHFHFQVQAFDPVTARPLWSQRVLSIGDDQAQGTQPSRIIGSSAQGTLLGQHGGVVWLLVDHAPLALDAGSGKILIDAAGLEQRNPALKGLLPVDGKLYRFDGGLVFTAADARAFVVRAGDFGAEPYTPPPPPPPKPEYYADGSPRLVSIMQPLGEVPARLVRMDDDWVGLYSDKEAADAANDPFGDHLMHPSTVLNEHADVRRSFRKARIITVQPFDKPFPRLDGFEPIPGTPSYIRGRFFVDPASGEPMRVDSGLLVWHRTRIDSAGQLALARLDRQLAPVWVAELPLGEDGYGTPLQHWLLPERLVMLGTLERTEDGVRTREPHLVSLTLADGRFQAWNLTAEQALP